MSSHTRTGTQLTATLFSIQRTGKWRIVSSLLRPYTLCLEFLMFCWLSDCLTVLTFHSADHDQTT